MAKYLEFIDVYALIFDLSLAIPYGFTSVDMVYEPITLNKTTLFVQLNLTPYTHAFLNMMLKNGC